MAGLAEMAEMYHQALEAVDQYRGEANEKLRTGLLEAAWRSLMLLCTSSAFFWWRGAVVRRVASKLAGVVRLQQLWLVGLSNEAAARAAFFDWARLIYCGI